MQLHLESGRNQNHISSYGTGYFVVNDTRIKSGIILARDHFERDWGVTSCAELGPEHFALALETKPELIVLGTGARHVFPNASTLAPLYEARIGIEIMGTGAACRTYNVLLSEGRNVLGMLMLIAAP